MPGMVTTRVPAAAALMRAFVCVMDFAVGQPPNRQPVNPRIWFETRGRAVLEALVTDLNSRGHSSLTAQENGEIFVQTKENETEPAKEAFLDFPEKVYWPQLVKVLESEGYAADARDADILVSW